MPTVILLDASLSMSRPTTVPDSQEEFQRSYLAMHGINCFLDYLAVNYKLEFVTLTLFASQFDVAVPFTRDLDSIKSHLNKVDGYGKTCIENALDGIRALVLDEWGTGTLCQVIVITDGRVGIGQNVLKSQMQSFRRDKGDESHYLPLPFNSRLHVMCVENPTEPNLVAGMAFYQSMIDVNGGEGRVFVPEGPLCLKSVQHMFAKLCEAYYVPFHGTLRCGKLFSKVQLYPPPEPYHKTRDFEAVTFTVSPDMEICGFLDVNDVSSPASFSRHLVLPIHQSNKTKNLTKDENSDSETTKADVDGEEEGIVGDEGKTPCFCVLLHGSLKVERMVALCNLGNDWYGMLYSWADSKKKSNLMLTLFEPGVDSIPWLGKLNMLSIADSRTPGSNREEITSAFPVKPAEKRSYAQSTVVWIRQSGLQADIQKILRHARKLPEKTQSFYKELNRLRRAALSFGFYDLLDGMASILERECTLLPGTAHPDAALQLTHAANALRNNHSRDYSAQILPLRTKFTLDDMA